MVHLFFYYKYYLAIQICVFYFTAGILDATRATWERKFRSLYFLKNFRFQTIIFLTFFLVFIINACTSSPKFLIRDKNFSNEENIDYSYSEVLESQIGIASYYADQFDGKITYSGEVYNMFGLSAAHPFYQMGTIVRVTNLSNGKSVIIPINDRMPFRPDRIIDLSLGVAQKLDMLNVGITKVKVEVLKWGDGKK